MSHPNDNPWQDERGQHAYQGQSYPNQNSHPSYQDQAPGHGNPYAQQPHQGDYAAPDHPPPGQQRYYGSGATAPGINEALHSNPTNPQQSNYSSNPDHNPNPSGNPWGTHEDTPPSLPPRRTATDLALPQGQDRSHQIEVMQSYEAAGRKDEDDQNVEVLQREFPNIDGSLIAAIYGDSKSLSATREMLGELER